jgi:hypothetical protein
MIENELAQSVVSVLSDYLVRKSKKGPAAYNASLENLLGLIEVKFSQPFLAEIFSRFVDTPSGSVETESLRIYLAQEIAQDHIFRQQLNSALTGKNVKGMKTRRRQGTWALVAALGVVVALVAVFIIARVTAPQPVPVAAPPTTVTSAPTSAVSTSASTSPSATESDSQSATPGIPGDGSSVPKGTSVLLVSLPRPNDQWNFQYGDHDVQLTQYSNSLWNMLATCNSGSYHGEQRFRLKNFTRLEVKAIGTDAKADPRLAVKFEVFVNDDDVNATQAVVLNPGDAKPMTVDLPPGTFALKLRTSFTTAPGAPCISGNAVWGSPYVVATGH